jgi:hypothetical protein
VKQKIIPALLIVLVGFLVWAQVAMPRTDKAYILPFNKWSYGCSGGVAFIDRQGSTCNDPVDNPIGYPFVVNEGYASTVQITASALVDLLVLVVPSFIIYKLLRKK